MNFKLEICAGSAASAIIAQESGANRVELCDNLYEGGTTPSAGVIRYTRKNLAIRLHVIIRPRGGDFLYSGSEFEIMKSDIEICKEAGADGVVFGILKADGLVDIDRCRTLTELAHPMPVTFHRSFDMCRDPFRGLEDVVSTGALRLLTSGQRNSAMEGAELIKELVERAGSRIIIMPGGGISESNIEAIARQTHAAEYHLTARTTIDSQMVFRREGIRMGGLENNSEFTSKIADQERIKNIINILKMI